MTPILGSALRGMAQEPEASPVSARIAIVSAIPDPAEAPYEDCLTHIKIVPELDGAGLTKGKPVVAIMWAFRARESQEPAQLGVGDLVELRITPFEKVEDKYGQIMRVDDTGDIDSPVYWAELIRVISRSAAPAKPSPTPTPLPPKDPSRHVDAPGASKTVQRMLDVLKAHLPGPFGLGGDRFIFHDYGHLTIKDGWKFARAEQKSAYLSPIDAIQNFHDQLRARGIELLVVFPPAKAAVFPDYATNVLWDIEKDGRVDIFFLQFLDELKRRGIEAVDLLPSFVAQRFETGPDGRKFPIFSLNDWHWASLGAKVAAAGIMERVKSQPWYSPYLAGNAAGRFEFTEDTLVVDGAKDPGNGRAAERLPPEPILFHRVLPASHVPKETLLPDAAAPIQVITDSYGTWGNAYDASFYDHLRAQAQAPVGMTSVNGGAVNAGLRQWAATADPKKTKVVVWLIPTGGISWGGPWARVSLDRKNVLALFEAFNRVKFDPLVTRAEPAESLLKQPQRALAMNLAAAKPAEDGGPARSRILWESIQLGPHPLFRTSLGVQKSDRGSVDGLEFQVIVDGKLVGRRKYVPPLTHEWADWTVDLAEYAGKTVSFQLRVDPLKDATGDLARWGEPEILDARLVSASPPKGTKP